MVVISGTKVHLNLVPKKAEQCFSVFRGEAKKEKGTSSGQSGGLYEIELIKNSQLLIFDYTNFFES